MHPVNENGGGNGATVRWLPGDGVARGGLKVSFSYLWANLERSKSFQNPKAAAVIIE